MHHGGDTYGLGHVVDFSANLNPLGTPPEVVQAVRDAAGSYDTYPDQLCRDLVTAIAAHESVPQDWIVAASGASDALLRICLVLKPHLACVAAPEFSGYEHALRQVGCDISRAGGLSDQGLGWHGSPATAHDGADIAFVSSPNNPTGLVLPQDELLGMLDQMREQGGHVVLDESFAAFADMQSSVALCRQHPQLVVVKSLTKLYAVAGLRLGYVVCSDADLVSRLRESGAEWAVSTPAQVAGIAALGVDGWEERTRAYVAEQRRALASGLESFGLEVVPGQANYLLFKCASELHVPMLEQGFAIRTCDSFAGLGPEWYRIAVRRAEENAAFLAALEEVLS